MTRQRLNAQEASEALGISIGAVRMRARRGTIDSERENGRLYVRLDNDEANVHPQAHVQALMREKDSRIEELLEQVHHLGEVVEKEGDARRRADTIIAQLTQANAALARRVPELEASLELPGTPQTVAEEPEKGEEPRSATGGAQQNTERVSWWKRMFG